MQPTVSGVSETAVATGANVATGAKVARGAPH